MLKLSSPRFSFKHICKSHVQSHRQNLQKSLPVHYTGEASGIKHESTTRNIRKPGGVGIFKFCTFTQNCNGLTGWSFEIPASAYCNPLCFMLKKANRTVKHIRCSVPP